MVAEIRPGSLPRDRLIRTAWAVGALVLLYAVWQATHWPAGARTLVGNLFFFPVDAAAVVACWAAGTRCAEMPALRAGWRLLAIGLGFNFAGDVLQTIYEAAGSSAYPSAADVAYLLFYPAMLAGLLRFPAGIQGLAERVRLALDLAIVAVGGAAVVIYVLLGPTVLQSGPDPLATSISIAYPVGDIVLLLGLGYVLMRRRTASTAVPLVLIAGALLFYVAGDLVYGYITLHSTYEGGDPVDSLYMVAIALFTLGAQSHQLDDADAMPEARGVRVSWGPYLAIGVAWALLLYNQRNDALLPDGTLVISAVLLAVLVSVRQVLAQRDLIATQGRLSHQSLHDGLTGLPNRALVIDRAERMLARARRQGVPVAALFVDIDAFKVVNDSCGNAGGDELLQVVAARLRGLVREEDTVGRLGADEFVVLLENFQLDAGPELVAERICEVLAQPIELERRPGRPLSITASVGIALGQGTADDLLRDAEYAVTEAKATGKNRWTRFESAMQSAAKDRVELEMDLKDALDDDQLFLVYQPTFDLRTETMIGVEALIRWSHPERGLVPPSVFIGPAEHSGLIVPIGAWVLRTACAETERWHRAGHALRIAVNVSARQLDDDRFVDEVACTLAVTGLDPGALTLEITETTLMSDPDAAARRVGELKALGVRIAVDDFGTGYSSLAYLRQFPVDELKIDRSFVSGIGSSEESAALIHTLVQLGKTLGLETLGEGIEEPAQLRLLQREECDHGQGFLFARPMGPEAIDLLLEDYSATTSAP
jgi:diguanylate cyclase (GGDEF)-like protein